MKDKSVNEIIRSLANEKGLSLTKLEERLNFGSGTISRWKTNSPNSNKLEKIADYFNVSVDYLLGRENKSLLSDDMLIIMKDLQKLSNDKKELLYKIILSWL